MKNPDLIFVFGSNLAGIHGAGAAKCAYRYYGAVSGVGSGPQGMCYAIPTKDGDLKTLALEDIEGFVSRFLKHARANSHQTFLVTPIGTGLAGYRHEDIAPMFKSAPENCFLPAKWIAILAKDASR